MLVGIAAPLVLASALRLQASAALVTESPYDGQILNVFAQERQVLRYVVNALSVQ